MKKRIFSILLCLCMVLMLFPVSAFADEYYTITQNFKYGTRTYPGADPETSPYTFEIPAGGSFSLGTVEDCSPYELVGWQESVSGTVYPPYAEIQNLQSDLTFDAVYQVQGGLTITVDGFMPGNTPDACTYTLESTIPGVTISSDDIEGGAWVKYVFDGTTYHWYDVENNQEFEAGTAYLCVISMKNYSLDLAPAVTVNGRTPEKCSVAHYNGVPYALEITCDLGTPVAPTLAVTVDNFEVGKTPADITYSFASTNLDVTFSEEDILANWGGWKYYYGGEDEEWRLMSNTEVFEAGTRYWRTINLDNKGLTVAPAVTMNGKTPEVCYLATRDGTPYALAIGCELGTPAPAAITISGPDEVCAEQDYEFSATAAEGAEISYFLYRCGEYGADTAWSRIENGVYYGTVPASEYGDADSMVLTVYGTSASGKPATGTKTVQILKEHLFVDGVCGCGAKPEYTITYDGGDSEGNIPSGVKTHGVDFTLSSETFTRDGYIQTGWIDENGAVYELGDVYTVDEDMTFYPYWEKLITVTVPFTTTVALGDVGEPGETTFELALIDGWGDALTDDNVMVTAAVTTDGAGDYAGTMTITGPEWTLWYMLSEGAFVQQVDAGADGWTVDDTVWGLYMTQVAAYSNADAAGFAVFVVPASIDGEGNYYIDWDSIDWENLQSAEMRFTNTYTAHVYELNHDAAGHWDECACGDIQNREAHRYGDWTVTKEATETEAGEKEHTCTVCGYTETAEIAKLAAKPDTNVPQTGDNSNPALWFALLAVSAAGVIGTGLYSKRRRSSRAK